MAEESLDPKTNLPVADPLAEVINKKVDPLKLVAEKNVDPLKEVAEKKSSHILGFDAQGGVIQNPSNTGVNLRRQVNQVDPVLWGEYSKIESRPFAGDIAMEAKVAQRKSSLDQFGNSLAQFGYNVAGGVAMALSSWDVEDAVDIASGVEKEYGNELYRWAEEFMAEGREDHKVYAVNPGEFDPGDPNWWFQQTADVGTSLGFAGEMILESFVLGAITAPAGGAAGWASLGTKLNALKNLKNLAKVKNLSGMLKTSKGVKQMRNQALFGAAKGYQEGLVEAYESYASIEQEYLDKGFTEEEAMKFASLGAATTFKAGVLPNMLLNSLQFATMSYNPVTGTTRNVFDRTIKNKLLRGVANTGTQLVSGATEELIQSMGQQEGQYQADLEAGETDPLTGRFADYLSNGETWNAFVAGAFGGAVFTGLSKLKNKFHGDADKKHWSSRHEEFINEMNTEKLNFIKDIKDSESKGDYKASMDKRREMGAYSAVKGLYLDALTDKDSAFKGYKAYLENALNYTVSNDTERLTELGIKEEDHEFIKENFPKYIADADSIKESFDRAANYNEKEAIIPIVENEYKQRRLAERSSELDTELQDVKNSSADYSKLSGTGIQMLDLEVSKEAIKRETSNIKKALRTTTGRKEREQLKSVLSDLEARLSDVDTQINSVEETELDANQRNLDSNITRSIDKEGLIKIQTELEGVKSAQSVTRDELSWWRDRKNQVEVKRKNRVEQIKKAKNSSEVKEAKKEFEKEEKLDVKQEEIINDKIEQMEIKEKSKSTIPDEPFGESVIPSDTELNEKRVNTAREINDIIEEDFTSHDSDDLFEPASLENITEENLTRLADNVKIYYNSLEADLGKKPSFSDFIRDFIEHNGKEATDKAYNALVEGWKRNGYPLIDFDVLYKDVFLDRKTLGSDILSISEEMITPMTKEAVVKENEDIIKEVTESQAPILKIDDNNIPILRDATPFRTSVPTLKAAFLTLQYKREIIEDEDTGVKTVVDTDTSDELNVSEHLNSTKLLNPDLFNPGTKLTLEVPTDYKNIKVSIWEDEITRGTSITFGEWARRNNIEEGSQEWISKIPIVAYDQDGEGVFLVHDTEWYNAVNVGLKDDPRRQREVIDEAKQNLLRIRNKVNEKSKLEIEITEKRLGTVKKIPRDQPMITLNEANPDTQLATANDRGELLLNGGKFFENEDRVLLNRKQFKVGHTYDIRKITGSGYMAFEVGREKLNVDAVNTVKGASRVYLKQHTKDEATKAKITTIRDQVLSTTGMDLFDMQDFETFLNQYMPTVRGQFSSPKDIHTNIENNNKISVGSPYASIQKGSLVFGVKGKKISGQQDFLYINPMRITDENGEKMINSILSSFDSMVANVTQNTSRRALEDNKEMVNISSEGDVIPIGNYQNYLKDNLKTSVKSFNVGTTEAPVYATVIQPVINYKESKTDWDIFVDTGEVSEDVIKTITDKIRSGESLTTQEESMRQEVSGEVESRLKEEAPSIEEQERVVEASIVQEESKNLVESAEDDDVIAQIKSETDGIPGLSILQEFQIVDYVFNQLASEINFKYKTSVKTKDILSEIKGSFNKYVIPKQSEKQRTLDNLKAVYKEEEGDSPLKALIEKQERELKMFDIVRDNWSEIERKAIDKLKKYTGIKEISIEEDNIDIVEDVSEVEKNYNKSSLQENSKDSTSYRLKRFFSGIRQVNPDGKNREGFLGIETYIGFDTVYSTLEQIISSPYEIDSNFDLMIARLEENVENQKWLRQVIDNLKNADDQIKNEFVYNFARHALSMKFMMFSKNRNNAHKLQVYDTNSSEITRVIRTQWDSNFKKSPLVYVEDGSYKINKERAKYLLSIYEDWNTKVEASKVDRKKPSEIDISNSELQSWLSDFGVELSDETINEIKNNKLEFVTSIGVEKLIFSDMFRKSASTVGVFGLFANYLENIISRDETAFEETPENHPFSNASNVLKKLSRIESKYTLHPTTNSFRDGGKSIYGFTPTKYVSDTVKKLKFDPNFRNSLLSKSFNKHSYTLKLLNSSLEFAEKFHIDHIGNTALKELGKKMFGDNSITALPEVDHEYTKVGFFQDSEQGEVSGSVANDGYLTYRMARMFFPTMADKSQMIDLYTAILDLKTKHFINEGGKIVMGGPLKEFVYSQLVKPELERISNFHSSVGQTNIKGYDLAAQMFLLVPELNNLVDDISGKRVISLMANDPSQYNMTWFEENMKENAMDILQEFVFSEVDAKREEWIEYGFLNEDSDISFLDQKYFDRIQGDKKVKADIAINDFVINNLVSNANIFMTVAGDLALYSQDKIKDYFQNGKPYLPKEEYKTDAYSIIAKDIIGVNAGKRLALLLAPGNKLANSLDSDYKQIFLEDQVDITSNIPYLVDVFYGNTESKKAKRLVERYNIETNSNRKKDIIKELSDKYPRIADYFNIETTDAQEYTTVKEHIDVLWGQGRITPEDHKTIQDKLSEGEDLTYSELKLVFQPIKPVYTGMVDEQAYDVMRMMYIKTSSFPLIPQVTKGFEIDKLRILLEDYQSKSGKNVRASYQSGNKVGAVTNPILPFNTDGTFNNNITVEELESSSITLDRNNFRIQQDVPFKSGKTTEDRISLGTQTLKLLFGDGMINIDGFVFKGETYTGKELKDKFNSTYIDYISHRKKMLYKQLGVKEDGSPIEVEDTINKLQDLLIREAEDRGFPKQDIEALKLNAVYDNKGNVVDIQFNTPLWLSPNSNRYESLLNAIVTNRLINVKLPGSSYVVGSEAGFRFQDTLGNIDQSKIVFTSKWEGSLKAAELNEDGSLKKAQVIAPSKFRGNQGNLISLIKKDGTFDSRYVTKAVDGTLRLKEDVISPELLNLTSFRIPTSSHVSMSQLEIVGILPIEMGDLMIVPKNLIKQKGLDFDVDKENTYKLWSYTDADGNMKPLDEEGKEYLLDQANKIGKFQKGITESVDKFIQAMFGEDYDLSNLEEGSIVDKLEDKLNQKLLENDIVRFHDSVLSNPDNKVQSKINKVLSMDFAKSQADIISSEIETDKSNKYFSILSDRYQKSKMFLGSSGKLGIGVYSNYVTFVSMVQQSDKQVKLTYLEPTPANKQDDTTEYPAPIRRHITIGNYTSKGIIGLEKTLDGKRSISEVFEERQNTATDNEKEQIMGRVNVNEITINVDCIMSALGFDKSSLKDGTEVSIPYLFISQPIIRDYVDLIRKTKSSTSEYNPSAKDNVISALMEKYKVKSEYDKEGIDKLLTGQVLFDNLKESGINKAVQIAVLEKFIMLDEYATKLSRIQSRLNINNTGLGKSFFETVDKYEAIQKLGEDTSIGGIQALVGDFKNEIDKDGKPVVAEDLLEQGYLKVGNTYIKPTTPVGAMLVTSVKSGYDLWRSYFPYHENNINEVTDQIVQMISSEQTSTQKVIELKQGIFKEMKKYFVSSQKLGLIKSDPQSERRRLFMDTAEGNTSLASYISGLMRDAERYPSLVSNKLLSRFSYALNTNGLPSTIKFDNTKGENFDEEYLYQSLIEMMEENINLPNFNGKSYSTRELAKDLIAYSYLEGGIQEATQFVKYIPVSYLNVTPFSRESRKWDTMYRPDIFEKMLGLAGNTSRFTRQYAQNNPEKFPKVSLENNNLYNITYIGKGRSIDNIKGFSINHESMSNTELAQLNNSLYISMYNPFVKKGLSKFQVYERDGNRWNRISTLGVFGMSEYSIKNEDVVSVINSYYKREEVVKPITAEVKESVRDTFQIKEGNLQQTVKSISEYDFADNKHLKPLASAILPFITNDTKLTVEDIVKETKSRGRYSDVNNKITIDDTYLRTGTEEEIAKTIIHEAVHSLTTSYINQYVDKEGNYKVDTPPADIINLNLLFKEVNRKLGPESEAYKKKRKDQQEGKSVSPITERERTVAYAGTNIREFVALVMTEPNFQQEMMEVTYKSTDKTLMEKFSELINNILKSIFGDEYNTNGVTYQGVSTVLSIIESQAQAKKSESKYQQMKDNDARAEDTLNSDGITPDDTDLQEPDDLGIFDDESPFDCN